MTPSITEFKGRYHFLSNFYILRIEYEGVTYASVEHAFQATKTLDPEQRRNIRNCKRPGEARTLGRNRKKTTARPGWDDMRIGVMRDILQIKFSVPYLRFQLIRTGDAELIEGNTWHDYFWGVCNGKGENNLGKLLMEIRAELITPAGGEEQSNAL